LRFLLWGWRGSGSLVLLDEFALMREMGMDEEAERECFIYLILA
jgi:hypothetical protein